MKPSVLVVDSSNLTAELVAQYLLESGTIRIVGTVASGGAAAGLLLFHRPEVVLVDRVPSIAEDWALIRAVQLAKPVLVLHSSTNPVQSEYELEQAGIQEVVFREVRRLTDLVAAIHRAAAVVSGTDSWSSST